MFGKHEMGNKITYLIHNSLRKIVTYIYNPNKVKQHITCDNDQYYLHSNENKKTREVIKTTNYGRIFVFLKLLLLYSSFMIII